MHEKDGNAHRILVGKPEGKRSLGRNRRRREVVDWMHLIRDRDQWQAFVDTVMNI
jgi:hypothetical protein